MNKLLLVSGHANSGKDACCNYISKKYGYVKIAFADKIKRMLMHLYNFSYEQLWGDSDERGKIDPRYDKIVREFIQSFGDIGRNLYSNTWVDYTVKIINQINNNYNFNYVNYHGISFDGESGPKPVIVPDGRYLNELEAIRNLNGIIIRIIRPNSKISGNVGNHSSEIDQDFIPDSYFDELIINDGTLEDLYSKIDAILLKYK